jgi:uncharacterized membrane protein
LTDAAVRGETRWPAAGAVAAVAVAQLLLPEGLLPGPNWVPPLVETLLLAVLLAAEPGRLTPNSEGRLRHVSLALIGLIGLVNAASLVRLLSKLISGAFADGGTLLRGAAAVWLTNVVVFGLLYWELDRGGPLGRVGARPSPDHPDLQFPQDTAPAMAAQGWRPDFFDYLFVSLTSSTAFSPTDTMPLTRRAKGLMGFQSLVSFLTVGLVAARAVNVLKG